MRRFFDFRHALILIIIHVSNLGCVPTEKNGAALVLDTTIKAEKKIDSPESYLSRLEDYLTENPEKKDAVRDVWLMVKAQIAENRGALDDASKYWLESLDSSEGEFGKIGLLGWITVNRKILGERSSSDVLGRLLLAQSEKRSSSYLRKENLLELAALRKWIDREDGSTSNKKGEDVICPKGGAWPSEEDPLLLNLVGKLCKLKNENVIEKDCNDWAKSLSMPRQSYFWGLMYTCLGSDQKAVEQLKNAIGYLEKQPDDNLMAVEAADHLATVMRRAGKRSETAEVYHKMLSLYSAGRNNFASAHMTEISYALKRIDRSLWAARSRALIGDYLTAKNIVHETFGLISKAQLIRKLKSTDRENLNNFRAEGYHILASRIAVEQGDLSDAINLGKTALEIPKLGDAWKDRFKWFLGLYAYIDKNKAESIRIWRELLESTTDSQMEERVEFWLARAYFDTGKKEEFLIHSKRISEHFPFGFYNLAGFAAAGLPETSGWKAKLHGKPRLRERLMETASGQIDDLRNNKETRLLLLRAEVLVQNNLGSWAEIAVRNLHKNILSRYPTRSHISKYLFLSTMYYMMGDYGKAISVIDGIAIEQEDLLAKYPEIFYLYYPVPYRDVFKQYAFENYLDLELLLAVAHVESKFMPNARSGAGARGLMQIIEPTATRYLRIFKMDGIDRQLDLNDPQTNIALSAAYIKDLKAHYKSQNAYVIGAYNAGESIIDRWLEVRHSEDLMTWLELVPFKETNEYIKHVWVGMAIYHEMLNE